MQQSDPREPKSSAQRGNHSPTAWPDVEIRVRHRPAVQICMAVVAVLLFAGFCALGTWQVHRRTWKLDLIARVDQRVHAPAVPAPGPDRWPAVSADADEYQHVSLTGRYQFDKETLTQASTALGSGYWVLTPLRRDDGTTVLINRGFVPGEQRDRIVHPESAAAVGPVAPVAQAGVTVTGLLRISEPGGGFLRSNDPANNRWYSRDVTAIATARGLSNVAPYFVDAAADSAAPPGTWPAGGMTVIAFHNSHLVYTITWYALALMVAGAAFYTFHEDRRLRQAN